MVVLIVLEGKVVELGIIETMKRILTLYIIFIFLGGGVNYWN
jgi:hypothetical protein